VIVVILRQQQIRKYVQMNRQEPILWMVDIARLYKRQLGWLNLPRSPTLPPPVTAKHRVVKVKNWMRESSFVRRNCDIHSAIKLSETEFSQL